MHVLHRLLQKPADAPTQGARLPLLTSRVNECSFLFLHARDAYDLGSSQPVGEEPP
jgi:hypothetical protein